MKKMTGLAYRRIDQCEYTRFAGRSVGSARFESGAERKSERGEGEGERERWRERIKKKGGGEHPSRHLEVNGTAKVYFVEEKTGCHATMGPVVGVQRAPRGKRDRVEAVRQRGGGEETEGRREGGYSSSSGGSCRCQCPPSCYPRRGPPEDSGAGHGGSSGSQIFLQRNPWKPRSIGRRKASLSKWIIRRGVSFWDGSFRSVLVGTSPTRCLRAAI